MHSTIFQLANFMPNKIKQVINKTSWVTVTAAALIANSAYAQNISGTIVNEQGQPIKNASVSLSEGGISTQTNEQGQFSFSDVNAGVIELHASAAKHSHANESITIEADDISGVNLVLLSTVMEVIDVQATPFHVSSIESAQPINVLSSDELRMKQASTIGETLKNEVGVHSSYYGPVASTPIIRGLDGPRVLMTQNGLDIGDASRVGPDHVVATEASTATQIEVLRGPATLFYGSGAIGGVVNVVDNRVPTSNEDEVDYLLQYNDVSSEKLASVNIQTGFDQYAFHFDGFWRDSDDYELAGPADIHEEEYQEEHGEEGGTHYLENSASSSDGATFGSSYLFDQGFVGLSYGFMNREYGIPGHNHDDHAEEHEGEHEENHDEHELETHDEHEEGVFAKMKQDRLQLLSEYNFEQQFLTKLATKLSYSDYEHQEIEGDAVGTTFNNKSSEARFDIYHQDVNGWQGAWTLHYKSSDFEAVGAEAFTPPSKSSTIALAWLEEKHYGDVLLQLGARIEHVTIKPDAFEIGFEAEHEEDLHDEHEEEHHEEELHDEHEDEHDVETHDEHTEVAFEEQSFTPVSASAGLVWDYQTGYNLGVSMAFSQRAPSASELFSFGPHIGTNTYEVGAMFELHQEGDETHIEVSEESANIETSYNLDLTLRKFSGDFGYVVSVFYNRVDDYYYQQDTGLFFGGEHEEHEHEEHEGEAEEGELEEGLPILIYQQDDVVMYGAEAEFVYQVTEGLKTSLFGDYTRARLENDAENDNLPRIPPLRLGAVFNYQAETFDSELSLTHYFDQEDVAELETPTDGYTMVDFNFNYYLNGIGDDFVVYVKGQNLTNEHARVHSSFLKDIAPLPARNISVGIRGSF